MFPSFDDVPLELNRTPPPLPDLTLETTQYVPSTSRYVNANEDLVEVGEVIGEGTYGKVCAAKVDGLLNIVVKVSDVTNEKRLLTAENEAQKLKELGFNEYTPYFYGVLKIHNHMYLEMTRCGPSLAALRGIFGSKPFALKQMCLYSISLMEAIAFIHSREIIHFDLKCLNMCIASDNPNKLKLVDFGSSLYKRDILTTSRPVQTVPYLCPEGLLSLPQSYATDVWAGAVMIMGMYAGTLPFGTNNESELFGLFRKYDLLPKNASSSYCYTKFMAEIELPVKDWDVPLYEILLDDCQAKRSMFDFLTRSEEEFCSLIMTMFTGDVDKRPSADSCAAMFRAFHEKHYR